MDLSELNTMLIAELEKGQTVENLVEYVLDDVNRTSAIITKHYGKSINTMRPTQKRLVREYIKTLI